MQLPVSIVTSPLLGSQYLSLVVFTSSESPERVPGYNHVLSYLSPVSLASTELNAHSPSGDQLEAPALRSKVYHAKPTFPPTNPGIEYQYFSRPQVSTLIFVCGCFHYDEGIRIVSVHLMTCGLSEFQSARVIVVG